MERRAPSYFRLAVLFVVLISPAVSEGSADSGSGWQTPFTFEVNNTAQRWAVTMVVKGRAISDGKAVTISVERCEIHRPGSFDRPQEVKGLSAGIIRHGNKDNTRWVLSGNLHPLNLTLAPEQSVTMEPFQLSIPLTNYPLVKGDTLGFEVVLPAGASVPISVPEPLPVTQTAAYCADTMEQFKKPRNPVIQAYHVCYDSAGRVRRERWYYPSADAPKSAAKLTFIEILDPVANLIYNLNPQTRKAVRQKGFTSAAGFGVPIGGLLGPIPGKAPQLRPVETAKSLGTKPINGVDADGTLRTITYPAGYEGRAEEVTTTEETWYSYRIQSVVRRVRTDPRNGDYEYQMTNIELGNPDASLFQVPDDYVIQ